MLRRWRRWRFRTPMMKREVFDDEEWRSLTLVFLALKRKKREDYDLEEESSY